MLKGNKCELCNGVIESTKAKHKQTKYCRHCARQKKIENTEDSWLPEKRREYMRRYMRKYRQSNPKLSNPYVRKYRKKKKETHLTNLNETHFACFWFLPLMFFISFPLEEAGLWFNSLEIIIKYLEVAVIKITSLVAITLVCWQHITHFLSKNNIKESKEKKNEEG